VDPLHEEIMRRIGADEVVSPEKEAAYRLAQVLLAPRLLDYIQLSEGHCLVQINAPEKFYGKTIRELDVRNVFSVNIVAIKKRKETGRDEAGKPVYEEKLVDIPRPTDVIDVSDVLVVIGEDADISRLAR
jgi:trk/ktr system potassium uptake protein